MKKIKMIISLIITIISLCYLSSCIRKDMEPKVYMYHPEVDFSTINFDIKVAEPEEVLIKEIYIKLYKENQLVTTLSSEDGINKVGSTEDIMFKTLIPQTEYRIEFSFDYFVGKYIDKDIVVYSYTFETPENTTGVSGQIADMFLYSASISFDAIYNDENRIIENFHIYLKEKNDIIFTLNKADDLKIGSTHCSFRSLPPKGKYTIVLCATFTYNEKVYEDLILDEKEFKTGNYDFSPTASIINVRVVEDVVTFDVWIYDDLFMLTDLSVVLLDAKKNIVSELILEEDVRVGSNMNRSFNGLYPNKSYTLQVIADYKTPFDTLKDVVIAEYKFKTKEFQHLPEVIISNLKIKNDLVVFDYTIVDKYNLLTDYYLVLLDSNNVELEMFSKADGLSLGTHSQSFDLLMPNTSYKIDIVANYKNNQTEEINQIQVSEEFETGNYSYYPEVSVLDVKFYQDSLVLKYSVSDPYLLLTSLKCKIINIGNDFSKAIDIGDEMSEGIHAITINDISHIANYKIQFIANYSSLRNVIIESFEYKENSLDDFEYEVSSEGDIYISKYIGDKRSCIIPQRIEGKPVTTILSNAFKNSSITFVELPDSITEIGYGAFYYCVSLTSVLIPNSVKRIGLNAFECCSSLSNVYFDGTLEEWCKLDCFIFRSSKNSNHFYLKNSYNEWEEVTQIDIPNTITEIGFYQFGGFNNVTSITIPSSITDIGYGAFWSCSSLTKIIVSACLTAIKDQTFLGCSNLANIVLPDSITSIDRGAFENCSSLKSITIPNDVISIGDSAFRGCSSITDIVIPDGVISIGDSAFYECSSLASIVIPNSVTRIDRFAFSKCSSLPVVRLPENITSIGAQAFSFCSSLKSLIIPDGVTSIGVMAFYECINLESITIPATVKIIEQSAFSYCDKLEVVYYEGTIKEWGSIVFEKGANPLYKNASLYVRNSNNEWVKGSTSIIAW